MNELISIGFTVVGVIIFYNILRLCTVVLSNKTFMFDIRSIIKRYVDPIFYIMVVLSITTIGVFQYPSQGEGSLTLPVAETPIEVIQSVVVTNTVGVKIESVRVESKIDVDNAMEESRSIFAVGK